MSNIEPERGGTHTGLWLSAAAEEHILVLDVEGTDGRERFENQVRGAGVSPTQLSACG